MSKHILSREIAKELKKLNDRIDRNIITGRPYQEEAHRHRVLLATMRHLATESLAPTTSVVRAPKIGKSPVRRSLNGSPFLRLFRFSVT